MSAQWTDSAYRTRPAQYGSHPCEIPDPGTYPFEPGRSFANWLCPVCESNWVLSTRSYTPQREGGPYSGNPPWTQPAPLPTQYSKVWKFDQPYPAPSGATISADGRFWWQGVLWRLIPPEARTYRPYKQ
jgi:hypothetical protein